MSPTRLTGVDRGPLIARLAALPALAGVPRAELEWLVAHGEHRRYEAGEIVAPKTEPASEMVVLLEGRITIQYVQASGRRHVAESRRGTITGVLPYSRIGRPFNDAVAEEPCELIAVHRDLLPAMTRECPGITTSLVHLMLDRARRFAATDGQDDKLVSLGRLAAGFAHELNNPASAAARSAQVLREALRDVSRAAEALGAAGLDETARAHVRDFVAGLGGAARGTGSAVERADREEAIGAWLESGRLDGAAAAALAEGGATPGALDRLAAALSPAALGAAVDWTAAVLASQALAEEVERATGRIYDLVATLKRFADLDRGPGTGSTDVAQGLRDSVAVHAAKSLARRVQVALDLPAGLPAVRGNAAELNQVWSNLIENALDAVPDAGHVHVSARSDGDGDFVVVTVRDDGPGIPEGIRERIFDPFFTTKSVGTGTGLGLDIVRRIVRDHDGGVSFESRPGATEFRVTLPRAPEG